MKRQKKQGVHMIVMPSFPAELTTQQCAAICFFWFRKMHGRPNMYSRTLLEPNFHSANFCSPVPLAQDTAMAVWITRTSATYVHNQVKGQTETCKTLKIKKLDHS
jgi:hypothetical protein